MPVNAGLLPIIESLAPIAQLNWQDMSPVMARSLLDTGIPSGPTPAMAHVEDLRLPLPGRNVAARLFIPAHQEAPHPAILYFHGGGWVLGTLDTHDAACRELAGYSGCAVLSVAYRLAPEHPFPAGLDDGFEALQWMAANAAALRLDPRRLAVAGDSAGANIAAAVAILARDHGDATLSYQALIYPVTDADFDRESYIRNGAGNYFLSADAMRWYWRQYLGNRLPREEPLAAILHYPDLSGLPPATLLTAEFDPLRDEGEAYAKRLAEAGVFVRSIEAPGMIHGFFGMTGLVPDAITWVKHIARHIAQGLA